MSSSVNTRPYICSVVIPTYCGGDRLQNLLLSLRRQTLSPQSFEIVIVDDASPSAEFKRIETICEEFKDYLVISIVRLERNGGPARARNKGIDAAQGTYIFFTDDDCEVPALWLETHLKVYLDHPNVSAVGGWYSFSREEILHSVYAQFWYILYQAGFWPINLNTFVGTAEQSRPKLPGQNTANLSVHRSVFSKIKFDENFVAPGREDTFLAENIRNAGYTALYIPFHVRHTSVLTFKRFWRVLLNRGVGNYVRLRATQWREYHPDRYIYDEAMFLHHLRILSQAHPEIRKNKIKLILLSQLYYYGTNSRLGLWYHGRRWRRSIRKRNGI